MNSQTHLQLRLANDLLAQRLLDANNARLAASLARPSIRRSIGHSIIRIGERLAAEPNLQPARTP
ncbi:MAG: hypothetical protein M3067_03870 [Chloroflexota bacterium]|nr:hypothetical protein [Chloroflexota bacterium]